MDKVIKDMVAAFYMKSHCMSLEDTNKAIEAALATLPEFIVLDEGSEPEDGDIVTMKDKLGYERYDYSQNVAIIHRRNDIPVLTRKKERSDG